MLKRNAVKESVYLRSNGDTGFSREKIGTLPERFKSFAVCSRDPPALHNIGWTGSGTG